MVNKEAKKIYQRERTIKRMLTALPNSFVEEGVVKMPCEECKIIIVCERSSKRVCGPCKSKRHHRSEKARDPEKVKMRNKEYQVANKDKIKALQQAWNLENMDKIKSRKKQYWKDNRETLREYNRKYRAENREIIRQQKKKAYWDNVEARREEKRKERANWTPERRAKHNAYRRTKHASIDMQTKLKRRLRSRIYHAVRQQGHSKDTPSAILTGCSMAELHSYLEAQFEPGMTWDNIHIDHIIPCASFDLQDPREQLKCFHYTNLQPLFGPDNLSKGSYLAEEDANLYAMRCMLDEN